MHTLEQLRAGELCGARHLKLSENLTEFPTEILSLKETLEVLDLTGNQLSALPDELAGFGKLRIIFCSENRFTELPEVLGRCPALTMVGFKANRIATVPAASAITTAGRPTPSAAVWMTIGDASTRPRIGCLHVLAPSPRANASTDRLRDPTIARPAAMAALDRYACPAAPPIRQATSALPWSIA